ncbi:hypothetical protein KGO95_00920 [Patescibacteria group bacterium]|nr:hypothetical protein [Patescibacteria group bacterium]
MTEVPPKSEKGPEKKLERFDPRSTTKQMIEKFLALSDEPGPVLTDEQEFELSRNAVKGSEAEKQWNLHKHGTKYRRNTLYVPLLASEMFLESPAADAIPQDKKEELRARIKEAEKHITDVGSRPFVKEDVQEVVDLVNEIKTYL